MLEYWYKEKRTLVDFRRGPLGPHFDGFAALLKQRGYSHDYAKEVLGKCCQFNAFLIEQGITRCAQISESLIEPFLDAYLADARTTGTHYCPRTCTLSALKHLFAHLIQRKAYVPPKPKRIIKPFSWLLDPYLHFLQDQGELTDHTIRRSGVMLNTFLEGLGKKAWPKRFKTLQPQTVETAVKQHLRESRENPQNLAGVLRRFFRYCASQRHTHADFSGLVPSIRRYRYASLPKGIDDLALETVLDSIPRDTPVGDRDYAILMLMVAYGLRGVSAAALLLDDLDWQHSRIRIRAQKGGKEVMLPLIEAVGEAIIRYLQHRHSESPFREVFLRTRAPYRPLDGGSIAMVVRRHLIKANVKTPDRGVRSLRHSWAIRALANNSAIKSIADVLGHRYINTTFIYAKADLKALREVAMPWPGKK
jgi:integrase/recombinase XerD